MKAGEGKKEIQDADLEEQTKILQQVKKLLDAYPMELKKKEINEIRDIGVSKVIE